MLPKVTKCKGRSDIKEVDITEFRVDLFSFLSPFCGWNPQAEVQKGLSGMITLVLNVLHPYECSLVAGGQRLERQRSQRGHASSRVWTVQDL